MGSRVHPCAPWAEASRWRCRTQDGDARGQRLALPAPKPAANGTLAGFEDDDVEGSDEEEDDEEEDDEEGERGGGQGPVWGGWLRCCRLLAACQCAAVAGLRCR